MDFNSPFGYPGEGPLALNKFGIWILVAVGCSPLGSFWTSVEGASRGCCFEKNDAAYGNPEELRKKLSEYGLALNEAGRPYSHYSETINAVCSDKRSIRRLMTGAGVLLASRGAL